MSTNLASHQSACDLPQAANDLAQSKLALRGDVNFSPRSSGGDSFYMIEDPLHSRFYRVGRSEYAFLSMLDGNTTLSDALERANAILGADSLAVSDAASIAKWLVDSELVVLDPARARTSETGPPRAPAWARWNPLYLRLPLVHPDSLFQAALPWLRWVHSPLALVGWLLAALAAVWQLAANWDHFVAATEGMLAPSNWLWLTVCWFVLKLAHEFAHGLACKHYGGSVREAGVMLMFFAPMAYVDVTTSWRFRSKWQRIRIAAAGMHAELFFASLAALVWSRTEPGTLNLFCFNVVIMASLTTVLFNANPLMRFDGYYILSDLLEIPNLYSSGQHAVRSWLRRHVLGLRTPPLPAVASRQNVIRIYGWLSLAWRVSACAGMLVVSTTLFRGAGVIVTVLAATAWIGVPVIRFARYFMRGSVTEQPNRWRFLWTTSVSAGALAALLCLVPWPFATRAPAVVEYSPLTVVRTGSAGFVREVCVAGGQVVETGDVLAVLDNKELELELADLDIAIQQSRIKARGHENGQHMAAFQAELQNAESLELKRQEKQLQVDRLTVRAPSAGRIIGRNLPALAGRHFKPGSEIFSIGAEASKELQVSFGQDDLDVFAASIDQPVTVRLRGSGTLRATLVKVHPRASQEPLHAALCASSGGPLPVRQTNRDRHDNSNTDANVELLEPNFAAVVALTPTQSERLRAGQLGTVTVRENAPTIGSHLQRLVARWVRTRLRTADGR